MTTMTGHLYSAVLVFEDGRRQDLGTIRAPANMKVADVRDGRFDSGGPGDWFFLKRLTEPRGKWVWEQCFTPPDVGWFEDRTTRELAEHFGWTAEL